MTNPTIPNDTKEQDMSEELRPCPFCGSTNLKSGGDDKIVWTWCLDCEATGPNQYGRHEWNTRAAFEQAVREAVEAERGRVVRLSANVCANLAKNSRAVGYDEGWDDALDIAEQHILSIRAPQETSE